ncbi:TonB-dependent receptor [Pseudoxanthomonas dokdonensis]|uniref:Oar protein n=1 Tax=Pseudoxanthomonas dokdonensis TaxID=344882 RepID=A0A0R0CH57_9GAMM|nr:TonB-dependent receptor [Pseudoxanthomonas dokdonensis]KRG69161.1 Oar protein [Pseudoxanthomonas dokdonensis]
MSKLALGLVAALAAAPVFAQSTSAGVGGVVTGADGQPVAGAEVTITHVESGTVSRVTTDASGRYNARGLRVGGPYEVTVNKSGAGTRTQDNVYLDLNTVNTVNASLTGDMTTLGAVQAVGYSGGSEIFSANKMGSGVSIDQNTINSLPSQGGNIQDYMRLDPRVTFVDRASGSISAGGLNPRYNSISIDGVSASDTFGLEGNNMPTRRQPVSMEAIEAIDVNLSNYDVSIAAATGATVNAVTKSGTNDFHGSVYGYYRDGDWVGDDPGGDTFNGFTKEQTYGATFGGPIVKDKLFFFANYEKFTQEAPGADVAGSAIGNGSVTADQISQAQTIFEDRYGVPAGGTDSNGDTDLEEYALKLDWNISDAHRASLRYSKLDQSKLRINGYGRSTEASLSSYWYQHDKSVESYVGQLFSDWTDNFSTEFKVSYRDYSAVRTPPAKGTPAIQLAFGEPNSQNVGQTPYLYMGTETNSQYNELYNETWNYYGAGIFTFGDHELKFGIDYSTNDIYNIYAPYVDGFLTYNSIADFASDTPSYTQYRNPLGGDVSNMAADYTYKTTGLFVQDQWYVNANLTLTLGLRADKYDTNKDPVYNAEASEFYGYDNSDVGGGDFLWQPRFGFNYTFDSELPSQLRGGIGLFQGESPQVWLSNAYNTTGLNYTQVEVYADGSSPSTPRQNVNFVSNDFEQPSVWKANLAFDQELPWYGIVASAELLLTKVNTALFYQRLDLGEPTGTGQDGRDLFWGNIATGSGSARANRDPRFGDVLLLDTTDKGRSSQFTVSLTRPWSVESDWAWSLAYTYTDAKEVSGLTSSTATSGWNYNYVFNANADTLSTARYEIKDRFSGSVTWKHAFFGDYQTQVGLVYEGRSGRPYSYVYSNDMNGDSRTNDLLYVPSGPGDVQFSGGAAMEQAFFDWLSNEENLQKYKGQYAPQNSGRADWVNTFDVRITQQLPGFMEGHKSEIWLDIQNIGNLINKDWGHIYDYGFYADEGVLRYAGIDPASGKYIYNFTSPEAAVPANSDADGFNVGVSQWSMQLGFRYQF